MLFQIAKNFWSWLTKVRPQEYTEGHKGSGSSENVKIPEIKMPKKPGVRYVKEGNYRSTSTSQLKKD